MKQKRWKVTTNFRTIPLKTVGSSDGWMQLPLPAPPYIMVSQHEYALMRVLDGMNAEEALDVIKSMEPLKKAQTMVEFDIHFGNVVFGIRDGVFRKVAGYLDTSD